MVTTAGASAFEGLVCHGEQDGGIDDVAEANAHTKKSRRG